MRGLVNVRWILGNIGVLVIPEQHALAKAHEAFDASGKLIDVGAASLTFQMAAMGTMPEMNNKAALTTTESPGKYRATVEIEMTGTWEGVISYDGSHGKGQVRMTVNVK